MDTVQRLKVKVQGVADKNQDLHKMVNEDQTRDKDYRERVKTNRQRSMPIQKDQRIVGSRQSHKIHELGSKVRLPSKATTL